MILIIILLFFFLGAVFVFALYELLNIGFAFLLLIIDVVIGYILWQRLVTGKTEWMVDDKGIKIAWTKQFAWVKNEDLDISWKQIEKISKGFDTNYYNLNIKLSNGKIIKFYHDRLSTKDDFKNLLEILYQTFNKKRRIGLE